MEILIQIQKSKNSSENLEKELKKIDGVDKVKPHRFFKWSTTKDKKGRPLPAYSISGNFNPSEIYQKIISQGYSIRTSKILTQYKIKTN